MPKINDQHLPKRQSFLCLLPKMLSRIFNMNYLEEYQNLRDSQPRAALAHVNNENCEFCNYIDKSKDCYLTTCTLECEKCLYGRWQFYSNHCIDCDYIEKCELLYECIDCVNCYNSDFLQDCENCFDCKYCYNCKGCQNCFGCVNLRHKNFYIFNKPYSPTDYKEKIKEIKELKEFEILKKQSPHINSIGEKNENSTGDHIFNNKNVQFCFYTKESQDCAHCHELFNSHDCFDITIGEFSSFNYDCVSSYHLLNSNFCYNCWESSDLEYCEQCYQCENCLLCSNLIHKKFYILNKPYEKEEYFKEKERILSEMKANGSYGKHIPSTYPFEDSLAYSA